MDSHLADPADRGINLLIYPSALLSSGRLSKISASLQSSNLFAETHIVGIDDGSSAPKQQLAERVSTVRIKGPSLRSRLGGIRIMLFWPLRVYRYYRREKLAAVAAQNVYLLPLAYFLSKRTGAVMAYNAHELETETIGAKGLKKTIAKFLERKFIHHAHVVSVVNDSIARWYSTAYPGVSPVVLTNTPVDSGGAVDLRHQLGIPEDDLLYIHVGFLMEGRNIPLLIETFSKSPHTHIAFLGEGYLADMVSHAAQEFPNIHRLPTVAPNEVVSVVRGADAGLCLIEYVSLSDKLSTPNKLMESLYAGIPPLSSDLIEARRLLGPDNVDKWILQDPHAQLAGALQRITKEDVKAFKQSWQGLPSWESQARSLIDAYAAALKTNP